VTAVFDADTAVEPSGAVTLSDRWNGLAGVNGGYMLSVCLRAIGEVLPFPDPLVVSGFFLRPGAAGPASVQPGVLRTGKTTGFGQASLWRGGKQLVHATAAFTDFDAGAGPTYSGAAPPDLPDPADCAGLDAGSVPGVSIVDQIEYRAAALPGWLTGAPSGNPASSFWMRFRDGREPDLWSLPLLVDAAAPMVLELGAVSTTVELTLHLRARPAPGWLAFSGSTRFVSGGYHEEDYDVWDSHGTLVAQSRQLALIRG
jgi:acyl-CoA thioesterase